MLHAWQKWGHDAAEAEYHSKGYDRRARNRSNLKPPPKFRDVVLGKLAFLKMVRGENDELVIRYYDWYRSLT